MMQCVIVVFPDYTHFMTSIRVFHNLKSAILNPIPPSCKQKPADQVSQCYSFSRQIHRNHVGIDVRKPVFGG